jgi:hypothetical protein
MEIDALLERFGKDTGLGQITLDESGSCTFDVDDMTITLMHVVEGGHLLCFAEAGELPSEGREALLLGALQANYLFQGTLGATLAVRPDSSKVFLNRTLLMENLTYETFVQVLSDFTNALEEWKKMIADYRPVPSAPKADAPEMNSLMSGYLKI